MTEMGAWASGRGFECPSAGQQGKLTAYAVRVSVEESEKSESSFSKDFIVCVYWPGEEQIRRFAIPGAQRHRAALMHEWKYLRAASFVERRRESVFRGPA